ncbi:mannitol dehydrogenase family protein [Saccharicrinis sp. GN24d3]|uniref:mannitol dehydrogenase family protein n=1 Tax=Saccharicrinis sp. GN24d3 TaxID=3458416 RepID=UPI004035C721
MQKFHYLNQENLGLLPADVITPTFNRDNITTSIVHIGVSNFHRAHQAYYTNELMDKYGITDCGICGVDLLDSDRKIYSILKDQDGLYTLITKYPNGQNKIKVICSIVEYFFAPENPMAVIEKMAHPDIQVISLTIAEDGYHLNEITGKFDMDHPVVAEDIKNPLSPNTVFGYLTQALKLRQQRKIGGCTIISCDNIPANGDTMKGSLFHYIERAEPELLHWVKNNVTFPNTMVDRITPVTRTEDIENLKTGYLTEDQWPVVCEPFAQWIIEDHFAAQRPPWEKVGVQFTRNIEPYENMKLRLLNAGHSILGILGTLIGYKTVYEAACDEELMLLLEDFMNEEVAPTLDQAKKTDFTNYKQNVITRFQNPHIKDSLTRICKESSAKVPLFILPTIKDQLKNKRNITRGAFIIAAWCKYNDGVDENGNSYEISDALSDILIRTAALSHQSPIRFLEIKPVFKELINEDIFVDAYLKAIEALRRKPAKACLMDLNSMT